MSDFDNVDRALTHACLDWIISGGKGMPQRETGWLGQKILFYRKVDSGEYSPAKQYEAEEEWYFLS